MSDAVQREPLFAQQALNVLRLVEVPGAFEPDRGNQPRRCEVGAKEVGAGERGPGEIGAAQGGALERGIGQIGMLERGEFEVNARKIGIAQDGALEGQRI